MALLKGTKKIDGDVVEKEVWYAVRSKNRGIKNWSMVTDEGLVLLAQLDLTKHEYRLMLFLMSQTDFSTNCCYITQSFMGEQLSIAQSNISKTLKSLESKGLIFREQTSRGRSIRINAVIAWRGTADKEYTNSFLKDSEYLSC